MGRAKRGVPAWQARWVALHDELHLLEVLLEHITPLSEYMTRYWALGSDVIVFGQDLQEAYDQELAIEGKEHGDAAYNALRRRLIELQARAQELTLDNPVE